MLGICACSYLGILLYSLTISYRAVLRQSAATLEAESGYTMEASEVALFRRYIMEASWNDAEDTLMRLGVTDTAGLWVSISLARGKYNSRTDIDHFRRRSS